MRIAFAITSALIFLSGAGAAPEKTAPLEMAITFDDLPSHSNVPPGVTRADISRAFVKAQKKYHAPPMYGFLNAWPLDSDPSAVKALVLWRKAGNLLGNHTFSHTGATKMTPAEFAADIEKNEPYLEKYMAGADWHYLRLPYLDMGETQKKRDTNYAWMQAHGYRLADVTMGFNDWDFNSAYLRCLKQNKPDQIRWLKTQYLVSFENGMKRGRLTTQKVWGHQIKHIYLLHYGVFDSLMFPKILQLLQEKHVRLIPFPEAMQDPVYAENDRVLFDWGGELPARVAAERHIPIPEVPEMTAEKLATICPAPTGP